MRSKISEQAGIGSYTRRKTALIGLTAFALAILPMGSLPAADDDPEQLVIEVDGEPAGQPAAVPEANTAGATWMDSPETIELDADELSEAGGIRFYYSGGVSVRRNSGIPFGMVRFVMPSINVSFPNVRLHTNPIVRHRVFFHPVNVSPVWFAPVRYTVRRPWQPPRPKFGPLRPQPVKVIVHHRPPPPPNSKHHGPKPNLGRGPRPHLGPGPKPHPGPKPGQRPEISKKTKTVSK